MIRISSGKYKDKKILGEELKNVRPTTDKVRQALFNKLQNFIEDATVLDLFAGTGALGIEALSHGAKFVSFVDVNKTSFQVLKQNLSGVDGFSLHRCDALEYLKTCDKKFDLILVDPPYKSGLYEDVLAGILSCDVLSDDGIVVLEHAKEDKFECKGFEVFDEKIYGGTVLTYLERENS